MPTMKALISTNSDGYGIKDVDIPVPHPGSILVRIHAIALGTRNTKIIDYLNGPGSLGGCEFAGIVEKLGEGVTRFKEGDRVFSIAFGLQSFGNTDYTFAELALAEQDLACHVPKSVSFEQASSMGLALITASLALFQQPGLQLKVEGGAGEPVLVSGGATAVGTMATQLLKIAGYTPIVTCSLANNELCGSYGAEACFDYHSPSCGADIRVHTDGSLKYVLDCVTDAATMKMCYTAIGSAGGSYIALDPIATTEKYARRDVRADWCLADTILGQGVPATGAHGRAPSPQLRHFGKQFFALAENWVQEQSITSHPINIQSGGLASIPDTINEIKLGDRNVQAQKLVIPILAY